MQSHDTTISSPSRLELIHGLPAPKVGELLRNTSDDLGHNKRTLAFYLFDMNERRLHLASGHPSTVYFAETQLDMGARRTRELI